LTIASALSDNTGVLDPILIWWFESKIAVYRSKTTT
jgi:hypothetical protein